MNDIGLAPHSVIATHGAAPAAVATDPRAARARPDAFRFVWLMAQLGLLLGVFKFYDTEEPAFGLLSILVVGGFAIHYWLPFEWKSRFLIGWSLASAYVMLSPQTATLLIVGGLVLYALATAPLAFRWRLALVLALVAVLVYGRVTLSLGVPPEFWLIFGAIFMFRYIVYLYEAAWAKNRRAHFVITSK